MLNMESIRCNAAVSSLCRSLRQSVPVMYIRIFDSIMGVILCDEQQYHNPEG